MIRLVGVELTRLRWRRAVLVLVGVAILVPMVILGVRVYETRPFSDADVAEAQAQVDSYLPDYERELARCERNPASYGIRSGDTSRCENRVYKPSVDDYLYRDQLRLGPETQNTAVAVIAILAVTMLLAGATFAGHDWASGSMSNQLLFDSRRWRIWTAKAVAAALFALVVAAVVLTLYWGVMTAVVTSRDLAPDGDAWRAVLGQSGRGAALVAGGALGGYALTMLSRSTVFTIGVLMGVAVAGGVLFAALLPASFQRFEPTLNALAVINGGAEYYVNVPESCYTETTGTDPECQPERFRSERDGVLYYAVLLAGASALSAASFRRRDV